MTDSGMFALCAAVIQQAVKDYAFELKKYKETGIYTAERKKLVYFFKSQWCNDLLFCSITGEEIMKAVTLKTL